MAVIDKRKAGKARMEMHMQKSPDQVLEQPSMEESEMGDEQDGNAVAEAHGPAHEVHMTHDDESGAHHVHSMHPDGHEHHSDHGSRHEAHKHAAEVAGAESEPEPMEEDTSGGEAEY